MSFSNPAVPNLTDFTTFVYNVMMVPTAALPTDSPFIGYAFNVAIAIVYQMLCILPAPLYALAVYNLGGDTLVNFAPDQNGQTYFEGLRGPPPQGFGLLNFVPGVITQASDVSTSTGLTAPDFMKTLTLENLQELKTPWGRRYLQLAQSSGTLWGIT